MDFIGLASLGWTCWFLGFGLLDVETAKSRRLEGSFDGALRYLALPLTMLNSAVGVVGRLLAHFGGGSLGTGTGRALWELADAIPGAGAGLLVSSILGLRQAPLGDLPGVTTQAVLVSFRLVIIGAVLRAALFWYSRRGDRNAARFGVRYAP